MCVSLRCGASGLHFAKEGWSSGHGEEGVGAGVFGECGVPRGFVGVTSQAPAPECSLVF